MITISDAQKVRLLRAHNEYIRTDGVLAAAMRQVEAARAAADLAHYKLTSVVDAVAVELGLNAAEHAGKYNLNLDKCEIEERQDAART